jgi:transcriptional regulator with XRE-family HTH domain
MDAQNSELYRAIGSLIEAARKSVNDKKITQTELANHIGLTRTSIVNIERGKHRIQIHLLYKIASYLGVELSKLLPALQKQNSVLPEYMKNKVDDFKPEDLEKVKRIIMKEVNLNEEDRKRTGNRKSAIKSRYTKAAGTNKKNRKNPRRKN